MSKFVVGQKIVGNSEAAAPVFQGVTYTVRAVDDDKVWLVEIEGHSNYFWDYRFDAAPVKKAVTITYGILSVTFDLSKPLGRKLMEAALEVIYKDAAA